MRLRCLLDRHVVEPVVNADLLRCVSCPFELGFVDLLAVGPWHHLRRAR